MALKLHHPKKLTTVLGWSKVDEAIVANMVTKTMISTGAARAPPPDQSVAEPRKDEVIVFRDFFLAGLQFSMHLVLVSFLQ